MFVLDFTKPYMYANTIAFYQGNLSTNNTLRCKLKTGSVEDLTGFACTATFYVNGVEIVETCKIIDRASCIVDIVLPSNALVAGEHKMEVILTKPNVSTIQSPMLKYEVWQGLTTGEGIEGTAEYPILVELINNTQQAIDKTNELQIEVKASLVLANEEIDKIPGKVQQKVDEITSNIDPLIQDIEKNEEIRQANEAERIKEEDIRKANEKARIDAELVREHNDADHEKAEAVRQSNEENRRVVEEGRVKAEALRVKAESDRVVAEDKRVQAENERQENYNFMTGDEERRRLEENKRIEAEKVRVASETERISEENKRRTVEASRVKAEETRVSSENTRMANEETRKTQETQRVQAETNRSTKYDKLIQDTNASIEEFHTFTTQAKTDETTRKRNETNRLNAERERREAETAREASESVRNRQEDIRVVRDENRENVFNGKVSAIDAKIAEGTAKISEVDTAKNTMVNDTKQAIDKMKKDFSALTASQQQDAEVITARDGEESLNGRLERDLFIEGKSLKQEVIDLGGLKESQDMAYATDKGYLVCKETKNGTVKDLRISGKSLVNKAIIDIALGHTNTNTGEALSNLKKGFTSNYRNAKPNTEYVAKFKNVVSNKARIIILLFNDDKRLAEVKTWSTDINEMKFTTTQETNRIVMSVICDDVEVSSQTLQEVKELYQPLLLDSNEVDLCNGYFEGIASVGNEVDEIEVSSVKSDGNLFDKNALTKFIIGNDEDGDILDYLKMYREKFIYPINVEGQITMSYSAKELVGGKNPQFIIIYSDGSGDSITSKVDSTMNKYSRTSDKSKHVVGVGITYTAGEGKWVVDLDGVIINKGTHPIPYESYKEDKKPILFKDTDGTWKPVTELRGLDTVCDTIELHSDSKYYYHQRTNKTVLTYDNCSRVETNGTHVNVFYFESVANDKKYTGLYAENQKNILCDKFKTGLDFSVWDTLNNQNSLANAPTGYWIMRPKGIDNKEWLRGNNVTVVYQLAQEKVFEVNPLFLDAYEGETLIQILSGAVNANVTLKLTSYISGLIIANTRRIKQLENEIYVEQEAQNAIILENDLRIIDLEMALMDSIPTLNIRLGGEDMQERSQLYFDFLVGRIESGNYTDEYLERVINKYLQGKRITQDEYDILYDMIYPPVYDLPQE